MLKDGWKKLEIMQNYNSFMILCHHVSCGIFEGIIQQWKIRRVYNYVAIEIGSVVPFVKTFARNTFRFRRSCFHSTRRLQSAAWSIICKKQCRCQCQFSSLCHCPCHSHMTYPCLQMLLVVACLPWRLYQCCHPSQARSSRNVPPSGC